MTVALVVLAGLGWGLAVLHALRAERLRRERDAILALMEVQHAALVERLRSTVLRMNLDLNDPFRRERVH